MKIITNNKFTVICISNNSKIKLPKYTTRTTLIIIGTWMIVYNFYHLFDSIDTLS